jgi:hypothetical protein
MKKIQIMVVAVMGVLIAACSNHELNEETGLNVNDPLEISVTINETLQSRAESEPAVGNYYFSYIGKNTTTNYTVLKVVLDQEGKGTPILNNKKLTWSDINTNVNNSFVLDNVPETDGFTTTTSTASINLQEIKLEDGSDVSLYDAAPAPEQNGTGNDLVWGTVKVKDVSNAPLSYVHFGLKHLMSMLTFNIESNDETIKSILNNPENIDVKLYRVITKPSTYNRLTGAISIDSNTDPIGKDNPITLDIIESEQNESATTENWIFPPQEFINNQRPILSITLTESDGTTNTFKGVLPETMLYENSYELLEFISGCHLTIKVELGNWANPQIQFRPVLVKKWVDKGDAQLNSNQVGVYTAEELEELVDAYNKDPSKTNLTLWKYGIFSNTENKWTFYLWKTLTDNSITETNLGFKSDQTPGFEFVSNGHTINGCKVESDGTLTTTTDGD